jgi:hypothetical protein
MKLIVSSFLRVKTVLRIHFSPLKINWNTSDVFHYMFRPKMAIIKYYKSSSYKESVVIVIIIDLLVVPCVCGGRDCLLYTHTHTHTHQGSSNKPPPSTTGHYCMKWHRPVSTILLDRVSHWLLMLYEMIQACFDNLVRPRFPLVIGAVQNDIGLFRQSCQTVPPTDYWCCTKWHRPVSTILLDRFSHWLLMLYEMIQACFDNPVRPRLPLVIDAVRNDTGLFRQSCQIASPTGYWCCTKWHRPVAIRLLGRASWSHVSVLSTDPLPVRTYISIIAIISISSNWTLTHCLQ